MRTVSRFQLCVGRVYDSSIGRFLSADPNVFYPFDPQDFNRYAYVRNNPLKYTDPSGYYWGDGGGWGGFSESEMDDAGRQSDSQSRENDNQRGSGSDDNGNDDRHSAADEQQGS